MSFPYAEGLPSSPICSVWSAFSVVMCASGPAGPVGKTCRFHALKMGMGLSDVLPSVLVRSGGPDRYHAGESFSFRPCFLY